MAATVFSGLFAYGTVSLGRLYSWITGTDTPTPFYTDPDLATPFDNPIELDVDGAPGGPIYMDPTYALKIELRDADDVNVWGPFDPIVAPAPGEPPAPACEAPQITTQPQDATVALGDNLVVAVVATGTAPLAYQWYLGATGDTSNPIAGATAATYTAITPGADTYTGWCRIANACGSVDTLTVTVVVS